jgi:hypothetical protein
MRVVSFGIGAVAAFGHGVVIGIVAPVERVLVGDCGHGGLLFRRIRGGGQRDVRLDALRRVLVDRGDVEDGQQMHVGETRLRRADQMAHAVGGEVGERGVLAAIRRRHRRVVDAEVAHVQLIEDDVLRCGQRRLGHRVPARGLERRVVEIHEPAVLAVHVERHGVGVGDDVVHNRAAPAAGCARRVDVDVEAVALAVPVGAGAGGRPDAGRDVLGHGDRLDRVGAAASRAAVAGRDDLQGDVARGGRPDGHGHILAGVGGAQCAVVGVEVVQHARNLHAGGVGRELRRAGGHGKLHLQYVLEDRQELIADAVRLVVCQMRPLGLLRRAETLRVVDQRDGVVVALDQVAVEHDAAVERIVEGGRVAGRLHIPGDGVAVDPVGALLVQVARGHRPAQDGQDVGVLRVGALRLPDFTAPLGDVQRLIRAGILGVAAVEDVVDDRLVVDQRHFEDLAEGAGARRLARGRPTRIRSIAPGVQTPEVDIVVAVVVAEVAGRAMVVEDGRAECAVGGDSPG